MKEKITVIVPVYKTEQFLHRCVDSILNQTYTDLEVILVDDGSPDACPVICDLIAKKDSRVQVIHQKNAGVSAARNTGLRAATGDYLTFVDSDDYLEPQMYYSMMKIADEYNCDMVMCDCTKDYSDHSEPYTHNIPGGFYSKEDLLHTYYPHLLMMENVEYPPTISNWLCLFKREVRSPDNGLELLYPVGVRFSEDLLFGAQLMRNAKSFFYMKGENLYHYCMNPQSATHVYVSDKWTDYLNLHTYIEEYFGNDHEFDFRHQIDLCLLFFVYNAAGDVYSASDLTQNDKILKITSILEEEKVKKMFRRIEPFKLPISKKQQIITWCYKHRIGISLLVSYYKKRC